MAYPSPTLTATPLPQVTSIGAMAPAQAACSAFSG